MSEHSIRILMVLASLFWSGAFIAGKLSIQQFPAFALTFFRFLFALPFIFLLLYIKQPDHLFPRGNQWRPLIILGVIGTFCYHALFFSCLKYTTAMNASLIGATNPMVTTILAVIFFAERLTPGRILGISLSFGGVFLVITNADWRLITTFQFNAGDLLMLAAVCCWAAYSLLGRRYMKEYALSPLLVTAYTFMICVAFSLPFAVWEDPSVYLATATTGGWLSILYMSLFASVLGYLFQMIAIQWIGAARTAIFINLVPLFTIIQSVYILGESFTPYKLVGAAIIIAGVYLATRPEAQSQAAAVSPET